MLRKTIAVDIDDVLAISAENFIKYSNKKWGTRLTIDDFHEDWAQMWKIDAASELKRAQQVLEDKVFSTHKHFTDAMPVLKKLAKNYKLVIATSRTKTIANDTLEWLDKYFPGIFDEIHHAGIWDDLSTRHSAHLETKAELAREIGAEYLIDDQPKHCLAAAEAGIKSILFGDYPWNRKTDIPEGVIRAHTWIEVEEYFDGQPS